jgi:hypothetical protein
LMPRLDIKKLPHWYPTKDIFQGSA